MFPAAAAKQGAASLPLRDSALELSGAGEGVARGRRGFSLRLQHHRRSEAMFSKC